MSKKHTIEFIKKEFEKEGYTLLSKEYVDSKTHIDYLCPKKHKHKITYDNWKHGKRCGMCFGTPKHNYEFIKQEFGKEGYQLLSTEYINNSTLLMFICPNGHKHKIDWCNWKKGQRCGKCDIKWSKGEKEIVEYTKTNYNGIVKENDRTLIQNPKTGKYLELDIWLPEAKKAIEYNGTWWHNNKYSKWKDNYKQQWCKENNIDLFIINEEDWIKKSEVIKCQLKQYLILSMQ